MSAAIQAGTYNVKIEEIVRETPGVHTFRLRFAAGTDFNFIPGQFLMLSFPEDPKTTRAYSISSSPLEKGYVDVTLNKVAKFSSRLFKLKGGENLTAKGPFGKWTYTDDVAHAVLISGGAGITPFRCIARYVVGKKLPNRLTVMHSSRTPDDIIYRRQWDELAGHPNIRVYHTITRPHLMRPGEAWDGPTGRITIETLQREIEDFFEAAYYLCGPNQLIESLSKALEEKGVDKSRIRYEKWGKF